METPRRQIRVETKIFVLVFSRNFFSFFAKKDYEKLRNFFVFAKMFSFAKFAMRIQIRNAG
jgi:hypothetical protein